MSPHQYTREERARANKHALQFALQFGDALPGGDDCDKLCQTMQAMLLATHDEIGHLWPRLSPDRKFELVWAITVRIVPDLFPTLCPGDGPLETHMRFCWRIQFCQTILQYMTSRHQLIACESMSACIGYMLLVTHGYARGYADDRLQRPEDIPTRPIHINYPPSHAN